MTISQVRKRVEEIRSLAEDFEAAHSREDDLYRDVLAAIRDGHRAPEVLAREALKASEIAFKRACA